METAVLPDNLISTSYGTVTYERGFEIVEIEGWVEEGPVFIYVFGDRERPGRRQRHTAVPIARIVEIDYLVADL